MLIWIKDIFFILGLIGLTFLLILALVVFWYWLSSKWATEQPGFGVMVGINKEKQTVIYKDCNTGELFENTFEEVRREKGWR